MSNIYGFYPNTYDRSQVLGAGTALFFAYLVSFAVVAAGYFNEDAAKLKRVKEHASKTLFLYGIAGMLSFCGLPGLHSTFAAVMAWLTLFVFIVIHVIYFIDLEDAQGKKRGAVNIVYYFFLFIWYFGLMISFFQLSANY